MRVRQENTEWFFPIRLGGPWRGSLIVHGDGTQQACFCSVLDVVDGLIRISGNPEAIGKVINLGSDEEIAIFALAKRVIEMVGSKSEIPV